MKSAERHPSHVELDAVTLQTNNIKLRLYPANKINQEVLFPEVGVFKLAAKKNGLPKDFQSSRNPECLIRFFSPNLPERDEMRSGYARLHSMQPCVRA